MAEEILTILPTSDLGQQRTDDKELLDSFDLLLSRDIEYRDFDLRMTKHPVTNNLVTLRDIIAVKRAVYNLFMTDPGERPFNPWYGVKLRSLLFELAYTNSMTIKNNILLAIEYFEPRIKVLKLDVYLEPDENSLEMYMEYSVINISEPVTQEFFIQRTK